MIFGENGIEFRPVDIGHRNIVAGKAHGSLRGQNLIYGAEAGIGVVIKRRGQAFDGSDSFQALSKLRSQWSGHGVDLDVHLIRKSPARDVVATLRKLRVDLRLK